jgi:hypothetical protein
MSSERLEKKRNNRFKRRSGADKTGRSKFPETFVKLTRHLLRSEAYLSLKPIPRAVYTELRRRFNGKNNGGITCSLREIETEVNCSKDSAAKAFAELQEKGFIKCSQPGSFSWKVRHAPSWVLTEESYRDELPTNEFLRWSAPEEKPGPEKRTVGPETRTRVPKEGPKNGASVLEQGPCHVDKPSSRS